MHAVALSHIGEEGCVMGKKAFDKIAAGLNEALTIARGEASPARLYIPAEIDVKAVRAKLLSPRRTSRRFSASRSIRSRIGSRGARAHWAASARIC
jgi:hypothetical protein